MNSEAIRTDANPRNISDLLKEKKYQVGYYQREFRWETKHVEELITDLSDRFLNNYDPQHDRQTDGPKYGHYFLGPVIFSNKNGQLFIVDGQQRLTTITLMLIFLKHLQIELDIRSPVDLDDYIISEVRGKQSMNLQVPDREIAISSLFNKRPIDFSIENESVQNLINRYYDIEELFPSEIRDEHAVLLYIDWLLYNVDLVEIVAYSDEEAYTIFESMNDRGLNLTPTEMLKGYLLTNIDGDDNKAQANELWKKRIVELMDIHKDEEFDFFKTWLRSRYAKSVRQRTRGSTNQDFEKIGTQYHKWVRDQREQLGLARSEDFWRFVNTLFDKYSNQYIRIRKCALVYTPGFEAIYYNAYNNFTLQYPLLLAPLREDDEQKIVDQKIKLVSAYLDLYIAHRSVNYLTLTYASQAYTMALMMMAIRDMPLDELSDFLLEKSEEFSGYFNGVPNTWRKGMPGFGLNQWSKRYIRYILARITTYIETQSGMEDRFVEYTSHKVQKPYEIEHIWADHFSRHKDEFDNQSDFTDYRNRIGGLLLVPRGFNQSYGDLPYKEKLPHYLEQNLLARSLHPQAYERNPGFNEFLNRSELAFQAHSEFKANDLGLRTQLYQQVCVHIWNVGPLKIDDPYV